MRTAERIMIIICAALAAAVLLTAFPIWQDTALTYGTVSARGIDDTHFYLEVTDGDGHYDWWTVTEEAYESLRIGDTAAYRNAGV